MTLPKFQPRPADPSRVYQASDPTCWCGSLGARDATTDLCRECHRLLALVRLALSTNTGAVVDDELEARRLPRLSDEGGNGGVALDVGLEKPQPKRTR